MAATETEIYQSFKTQVCDLAQFMNAYSGTLAGKFGEMEFSILYDTLREMQANFYKTK